MCIFFERPGDLRVPLAYTGWYQSSFVAANKWHALKGVSHVLALAAGTGVTATFPVCIFLRVYYAICWVLVCRFFRCIFESFWLAVNVHAGAMSVSQAGVSSTHTFWRSPRAQELQQFFQ